jgi:hypothetical protein
MLAGESCFTPQMGAAICARVAAGEPLARVMREAGMPHRTTVRNWRKSHPEFAMALWTAMLTARTARRRADRAARAAALARPAPLKGGSESTYSEAVGEAICARIANGESVVAIGRDPDMPCAGTVYAWAKRHPDFEAMYVQARRFQADYLFDEAREVALATTPATVWVGRLQFDVIRWQAARLAPRKYCEPLVAAAVYGEDFQAEAAARVKAEQGSNHLKIEMTHFRKGPNGEVLAAPPRNEDDERRWREAYGTPYDGPRWGDELDAAPSGAWRTPSR